MYYEGLKCSFYTSSFKLCKEINYLEVSYTCRNFLHYLCYIKRFETSLTP